MIVLYVLTITPEIIFWTVSDPHSFLFIYSSATYIKTSGQLNNKIAHTDILWNIA